MYFISSRSVLLPYDKVQNGICERQEILNLGYPTKLKKWFIFTGHFVEVTTLTGCTNGCNHFTFRKTGMTRDTVFPWVAN